MYIYIYNFNVKKEVFDIWLINFYEIEEYWYAVIRIYVFKQIWILINQDYWDYENLNLLLHYLGDSSNYIQISFTLKLKKRKKNLEFL